MDKEEKEELNHNGSKVLAKEVVEKEEEGKKKEWGAAANRSSFVAQARAAVAEAFPSLQIRTLRTFPIKYV